MISDPINIVVVHVGTIRLWDAVPRFNSGQTTTPAQAVVLAARSVTLDFKDGDFALLSSTPDGTGFILTDNFIAINGVNICGGSPGAGCFTGPSGQTPVSPIDVSSAIPIDENLVMFEWKDYGGVAATSVIFLVTSAKISE